MPRALLTPEQRIENRRAANRRYKSKIRARSNNLVVASPKEEEAGKPKEGVAGRERENYLRRVRRRTDPEFRFKEKLYRVRRAEKLAAEVMKDRDERDNTIKNGPVA